MSITTSISSISAAYFTALLRSAAAWSFLLHMHQVCLFSEFHLISFSFSSILIQNTFLLQNTKHHLPQTSITTGIWMLWLRHHLLWMWFETIRATKDIYSEKIFSTSLLWKKEADYYLFFHKKIRKKKKNKNPSPLKRSEGADVKRGSAVCYRARCCDRRFTAVEWGVKKTLGSRREVFEHLEGSESEGPA